MITLDATTETLEVVLTAATQVDWFVTYAEVTATTFLGVNDHGTASAVGAVTVVAAPGAAGTQRQLKYQSIRNRATTPQTATSRINAGGGVTRLLTPDIVLQGGETLEYTSGGGWYVITLSGARKVASPEVSGIAGRPAAFLKVGTAAEAAGNWYCHAKDTGMPGAWSTGAPGLAGRACDGTTAADVGCLTVVTPSSGNNYLTKFDVSSSAAQAHWLLDVLWVNTGIAVATTTAQAINSIAFAARDLDGTANGGGVWVGILVTAATTNAAAIANTTLTYTNQDNVAGRTATMAAFPATAVIGTVVWFQLQAGDVGVRSIQSITLGTSYVAGSISLIAATPLAMAPSPLPNVGGYGIGVGAKNDATGVRLYAGACLLLAYIASATTATNTAGVAQITNR